jgi:hypothetical protein
MEQFYARQCSVNLAGLVDESVHRVDALAGAKSRRVGPSPGPQLRSPIGPPA